jgi:hypothetical protein
MTSQEKILFIFDIIFAVLATWFLFPQCKLRLWPRLVCVAVVYGVNIWFFARDNNVNWLFVHMHYYSPLCLWVFLAAIRSWAAQNRNSNAWWNWSTDNFFRKHSRFIWSILIVVYLFLAYLGYSIWQSVK